MKKLISAISTIFIISLISFQTDAQSIGIKAGFNLATMLNKDANETYSNIYSMNPGFHIGAIIDVRINDFLTLEPGLLFTTKGTRYELEMVNEPRVRINLYYFDFPLNIRFSHDCGNAMKLFATVGPYLGIGISGKIQLSVEDQGNQETEEREIKWGNDVAEDDIKRLDMGLTFGGGIEINSILAGISYDLGLYNISANQNNGKINKNRILKFSVGYRFGK